MPSRVLFVLTNHEDFAKTGIKVGWYIVEVAIPYWTLRAEGHIIDFVSPKGGKAPMQPNAGEALEQHEMCQRFLNDKEVMEKTATTMKPSEVNPSDYKAIFYPGGYGPLFDIPDNKEIAKLAATIYENGGIVSAVCHGPVGLVPIVLSNGEHIIKGKKVTGYTNEEEDAVKITTPHMPFLVEDKLKELGGNYVGVALLEPNVQVDGRLITGQNPASSEPLAKELNKLLN